MYLYVCTCVSCVSCFLLLLSLQYNQLIKLTCKSRKSKTKWMCEIKWIKHVHKQTIFMADNRSLITRKLLFVPLHLLFLIWIKQTTVIKKTAQIFLSFFSFLSVFSVVSVRSPYYFAQLLSTDNNIDNIFWIPFSRVLLSFFSNINTFFNNYYYIYKLLQLVLQQKCICIHLSIKAIINTIKCCSDLFLFRNYCIKRSRRFTDLTHENHLNDVSLLCVYTVNRLPFDTAFFRWNVHSR